MKKKDLEGAARTGRLKKWLNEYLAECHPAQGGKKDGRFPNLAGFCRWLGCGMEGMERLRLTYPDEADYLTAVMEDEALNSPILSPTIVGAYLKRRLCYGEKGTSPASLADCGEVRLVFDHDIAEDGE